MYIQPLRINGLFLITPKRHEDARGFFMEVYRADEFKAAGVTDQPFVQQNHSSSVRGVLRGLHVQYEPALGKLIRIIHGAAFVAAVDIRFNSPTRGKWFGIELSAENKQELFVPVGFASGFCVTGDVAEVEYHYTVHYNPHGEASIRWNDPEIGIDWPIHEPTISPRDQAAVSLADWLAKPEARLL